MFDVSIIGAGPAGLQAAIYTASEGLKTCVMVGHQLGGQIHDTPKLENFAGQNSRGVSGPDFIKSLVDQCKAFNVKFIEEPCNSLTNNRGLWDINNGNISSRSCVIATGYKYKVPECKGLNEQINKQAFIGPFRCMSVQRGLTYCVVGGGNSAGQAIMSLAEHANKVHVITRSGVGMSQYLVDRIKSQKNISVSVDITPIEMGKESIRCSNNKFYSANYFFFCIGGTPSLDFIPNNVILKEQHVVVNEEYQTNLPGLYAIGDVRYGVRRHSVGTCIGDAAACTAYLHDYLNSGKAPSVGG